MKSLKVTLLIAVFALTFSGVSSDKSIKVASEQEQIETYKQLKKESKLVASILKKEKAKPPMGI